MAICAKCNTENADASRFCQSCGAALPPSAAQTLLPPPPPLITEGLTAPLAPSKTSGMAITSLVLAFFVPLLAIIFGIIGLIQISNSQGRLRGSGLAIAGLAVSCFWSFLVMPAILFPVFAQAREKARTVSCESNQRQLALAIIMYSQDNNEQLPPSMSATTLATPGTLSARLYTCPSATTHAAAGDYGYNTHLAKRALGDIADPATTILTADSDRPDASLATTDDIAWTRHHTGCVISFVDGHVAIKTKDDSGSITLGPATRKAN